VLFRAVRSRRSGKKREKYSVHALKDSNSIELDFKVVFRASKSIIDKEC